MWVAYLSQGDNVEWEGGKGALLSWLYLPEVEVPSHRGGDW